jgi:hypothetical protein
VQGVTESLIKRYGVPLVVLSPVTTGVLFVAYMGHGRFDMPEDAPVFDPRQPVLQVNQTTTMETASEPPPASVPLPTPAGSELRSSLPATLLTHDSAVPAIDAPMLSPVQPSSDNLVDLFAYPASE